MWKYFETKPCKSLLTNRHFEKHDTKLADELQCSKFEWLCCQVLWFYKSSVSGHLRCLSHGLVFIVNQNIVCLWEKLSTMRRTQEYNMCKRQLVCYEWDTSTEKCDKTPEDKGCSFHMDVTFCKSLIICFRNHKKKDRTQEPISLGCKG